MGGRFTIFGRCVGADPSSDELRSPMREAYQVKSMPGNLADGSLQLEELPGASKALDVCSTVTVLVTYTVQVPISFSFQKTNLILEQCSYQPIVLLQYIKELGWLGDNSQYTPMRYVSAYLNPSI